MQLELPCPKITFSTDFLIASPRNMAAMTKKYVGRCELITAKDDDGDGDGDHGRRMD